MAAATTVVLSLIDAKLYRGTPNTTTLPATTLVTTVENVSLKITMEEAAANNRLTAVKQQLPSLAGIDMEINFLSDSADTHLAAFRTAFINRQPIPLRVIDAAGLAFGGLMGVFGLDNDQQLSGVPMNKFTLKPWAVGFAGTQPTFA
jgi:hypothetical protein